MEQEGAWRGEDGLVWSWSKGGGWVENEGALEGAVPCWLRGEAWALRQGSGCRQGLWQGQVGPAGFT